MKKIDNIKTNTYSYCDDYFVDIVISDDEYYAFLYNINYGIKKLMFGVTKRQQTYDEFIAMIENNITDYICSCIEEYED